MDSSQWSTAQAGDGRTYYYNSVTKQTQWSKPPALMTPTERALESQPFVEYCTAEGKKYWYNKETKVSSWEMPEVYRHALDLNKALLATNNIPAKPPTPAQTFVAGGAAIFAPYHPQRERDDFQQSDRGERGDRFDRDRERPSNFGQSDTFRSNFVPAAGGEPEYATYEEAEATFMKVMKRYNVQPDWTFKQMVGACVKDPQYRSIKDPKDRQAAFEKYQIEVKLQEKEREKERAAKLRQDFQTMLKSHPEITYFTRWKTARPIIEGETIFRSTDNEAERHQLFLDYISELRETHEKKEAATRRSALDDLSSLIKELVLDPYTKWADAREMINTNEHFQTDDKFQSLSKLDVLNTFADHIRAIERNAVDERQREKAQKTRVERKNRDNFKALLAELKSHGLIKAGTRWMDIYPHLADDPRYDAILGQSGSTPLDLFWDVVEEEEQKFRGQRNEVLDALDDKRFEMTAKTTVDAFMAVVQADRRTSHMHREDLELIFHRLHDKVAKREEEDRHHAERAQRRAVDALRSVIKHLDPPVRITDSWDRDDRPRVEHLEEFRALDEDSRRTAFDKVVRRLKEKEAEAEHERSRRSERPERDSRRNGDRREARGRARYSRTPEPDAYEADRKRAVAERERQYHKTSNTVASPAAVETRRSSRSRHGRDRADDRERYPERERERERDRFDDHDRYERGSGRLSAPLYDRERRERDLDLGRERERPYVSRADPRDGAAKELDYGESGRAGSMSGGGSVGASGSRRRRGSEMTDDGDGKRDVKRARKERERRSKTPVESVGVKEEEALKSGSEEGEIEEV